MAAEKLKTLRSVLDGLMKTLGLDDPTQGIIYSNWVEIVGPEVAAVCRIERLSRGRLFLRTDSSAWSYELSMRREALRERINGFLNANKISEVHVKAGTARGQ